MARDGVSLVDLKTLQEVRAEIAFVGQEIKAVDAKLEVFTDREIVLLLMREKEQLRDEKRQLREKELILIEHQEVGGSRPVDQSGVRLRPRLEIQD